MNADSQLFTPIKVGRFQLQHRVVLAPLTRMRNVGFSANMKPEQRLYYEQRSSKGGLVINEATLISPQAGGYKKLPGIWNEAQARQWKPIVEAIKAKGGIAVAQIWHQGRAAEVRWKTEEKEYEPVAPSALKSSESAVVPRPMTLAEIDQTVEDYGRAARLAIEEAGFDMVEIHGANGYLLDQFLQSVSNKRTDDYGGSLENRMRFPLRVAHRVASIIGADRLGYRISPFSDVQNMREQVPLDTFLPFVQRLLQTVPDLAYIHYVEPRVAGIDDRKAALTSLDDVEPIRQTIKKHNADYGKHAVLIAAGGYHGQNSIRHADSTGDLIAYGRYFIANPDLPERIRNGWPLQHYDRPTFYKGDAKGYVDYPTYNPTTAGPRGDARL